MSKAQFKKALNAWQGMTPDEQSLFRDHIDTPPNPTTNTLAKRTTQISRLSTDDLKQKRDDINQELFNRHENDTSDPQENAVIGMASMISKRYFEDRFEPYIEAKWRLFSIVNMMDKLSSMLPDDLLKDHLNKQTETDLSGNWYMTRITALSMGHDFKTEMPEVVEAIEGRLKALLVFRETGNSEGLREYAKKQLRVEQLDIIQVGRPADEANKWIARRADQLKPSYPRSRTQTNWQELTSAILTEIASIDENDPEARIKSMAYRAISFYETLSEQADFVKGTHYNQIGKKR